MPINSGYKSDSQLLREISKLNLSGSGTGFKYVKSATNCELVANQESIILEADSGGIREILLTKNTPEAIIELFWEDGTNKVKIPDTLDRENDRYFDSCDGGLTLSVLSDINANIDIYIRSTKLINYKVGNAIEIPEVEEPFYLFPFGNIIPDADQEIEIIKIPIKPVNVRFIGWEEYGGDNYPIYVIPYSEENGYENSKKKLIIENLQDTQKWSDFTVSSKYYFYIDYHVESHLLFINNIYQNAIEWFIELEL